MLDAHDRDVRRRRLIVLAAIAICVLSPLVVNGQPDLSFESWVKGLVDEWQVRIGSWRWAGRIVLGLTLAVGILGIVIAAVQASKQRAWKAISAGLGVAISILTLVKTTVYDVEHRAYRHAADTAEQRVAKIRRWIAPFADEAERREAIAQVRKLVAELEQIDERLHAASAASTGNSASTWTLEPVAFAQAGSAKPSWLTGRAPDKENVYFVGVGVDANLAPAKREAFDNAVASARETLAAQLPIQRGYDPVQLANYLAEAGTEVDSYFERGPDGYRYFTLFGLAKRRMATDARLFGFRENVSVPAEAVQATQSLRPPANDYQTKRNASYEALNRHARSQISADAYRLYQSGRSLRLRGEAQAAKAPLSEAVAVAPGFFMAWYNLGLAQEATGNTREAEDAYKRALALEPQQPTRDASIYNTYGWLLYRLARYQDAKSMFQSALTIDPSHPIARQNLAAVEARLKDR